LLEGETTANGSASVNLPTSTQDAFNTTGFDANGSGASITGLTYTYSFPVANNPGQAPATLATNQPFQSTSLLSLLIPFRKTKWYI